MRDDRDDELLDKQLNRVGKSLAGTERKDEVWCHSTLTGPDQRALKDSEECDGGKHRE